MPQDLPNKDHFQQLYAGMPPWDIGKPQPVFIQAADRITGSVLDAGCGTGENALFFANRGQKVTGIDFLEGPIAMARQKAQERDLPANFLVIDALALEDLSKMFDSVIDCGLFHTFSDEDRIRYLEGLTSVLNPDGRLFLLCFSDKEPLGEGPRRISQQEIQATFASGWEIESIQDARFEIRPDFEEVEFSKGGPLAWFCTIRRTR